MLLQALTTTATLILCPPSAQPLWSQWKPVAIMRPYEAVKFQDAWTPLLKRPCFKPTHSAEGGSK